MRNLLLGVCAVLGALAAPAGCSGDDAACAPDYTVNAGADCEITSGTCYERLYRMTCARNASDDGYACQCYFDGTRFGTGCLMSDICDSSGPLFQSAGEDKTTAIYDRMRTCCGFDLE